MNAIPKPRPRLLDKQDASKVLALLDRAERLECKRRSKGQCEVEVVDMIRAAGRKDAKSVYRCPRRASENHHLIGGSGRRNKGRSILARHRLDTCSICHSEITNHVLRPVGIQAENESAATVRYSRLT